MAQGMRLCDLSLNVGDIVMTIHTRHHYTIKAVGVTDCLISIPENYKSRCPWRGQPIWMVVSRFKELTEADVLGDI